MSARDKSRFSTRQAGWIALAIFAAWLVFLLVPTSPRPKPAASTALPPMAAQSKLEAAGLANNSDWQGLPGYFAVWADALDWSGNKTRFAYWNPGSNSYSYFFEATREADGIKFRAISPATAGIGSPPSEGALHFEEEELARYAESRRADSPTHPFVFPKRFLLPQPPVVISAPAQPIPAPAVQFPGQPDAEPKK